MEKYLSLAGNFIKRMYFSYLGVTLLFCLLSGWFVSFRNLDASQSAKVMEFYLVIIGILLLTPLFTPEQDKEIWLLEQSKALSMWKLYLIRIMVAVLYIAITITTFEIILYQQGSMFPCWSLWIGTFSEVIFLGSIGFFVSAITNQVVIGFMVSVMYYAVNIGISERFGSLGLFQMMRGTYNFWYWMLMGGVVLIIAGIIIRESRIVSK